MPTIPDPALERAYAEACAEQGKPEWLISSASPLCVHVADDPDRAWSQVAPHALHEMNAYAEWSSQVPGSNPYVPIDDADVLREQGIYAVVTPQQCVELFRALDDRANLILKPLVGGLDPEVGMASVERFVDAVLPVLERDGLLGSTPT